MFYINVAMAAELTRGLIVAYTTLGVVTTGGAALIEGATLTVAKLLTKYQDTTSKTIKAGLGAIAFAAAAIATSGVGLTATFVISLYTSSTAIPFIAGTALATTTLPAHYKAFQWAKFG